VLVTGLLMLALAGPATAETLSGHALVLEKDLVQGTVTLDGGIVLRVDAGTRILSQGGQRISLMALPAARHFGGGYLESGEATVHFEARTSSGGVLVAEEIQILGETPR
jgi:hypothetical protein